VKLNDALVGLSTIFLDSAPMIYYVQNNPQYADIVDVVFARIDSGTLTATTSPVTLAECLVMPFRTGQSSLQQAFTDKIVLGNNTTFVAIGAQAGQTAAELRARYNIGLLDALQISVAM
jgi:predicted nucleic acid-binding protein